MGKQKFTIQASHRIHSIDFCEALAKEHGVQYGGICENRHFFENVIERKTIRIDETTSKIVPRTYGVIDCRDEDISNGSFPYFVKHGLTHPSTPAEVAFFETEEGMDLLDADWHREPDQ